MKEKKYIALGGVQGTGKTTFALGLAHQLKVAGKSANIWTDIPRECPLPINEEGSTFTQLWLTGKMVTRTLELCQIYDYVISDRTPLDCVMYQLIQQGGWDCICDSIMEFTGHTLMNLDSTLLWVKKGWTPEKFEKGRTTDEHFNKTAPDAALEVRMRLKSWERQGLHIIDVDLLSPPSLTDIIG